MSIICLTSTIKADNFNDLFYKEYAALCNELKFTPKELDVIACLMNGKDVKSTAQVLEIAVRTVDSHIRNIMLKIGCHSRAGIINCIEKSNQYHFIKHHYPKLQLRKLFNQNLQNLKDILTKDQQHDIFHINIIQQDQFNFPINQFIKDLTFVGIQTNIYTHLSKYNQDRGYIICIGREAICESTDQDIQTICIDEKAESNESPQIDQLYIVLKHATATIKQFKFDDSLDNNFNIVTDYFNLVMNILHELFQTSVIKYCIKDFQQQFLKLAPIQHVVRHNNPVAATSHIITRPHQKFFTYKNMLFLLGFVIIGMTVYLQNVLSCKNIPQYLSFKSQNSQLLKRPYLLRQIALNLNNNDGIETVVISGLGGAGKTTLARQYAETQDHKVIWEINVESPQVMLSSFGELAGAMIADDTDQKVLNEIAAIKNFQEKNSQLLHFITNKLKQTGKWLLIYDNVGNFDDIKNYYPNNEDVWGHGHVIVTTQNSILSCHPQLNKVLHLDELTAHEKFTLFIKAAGIDRNPQLLQKDEKVITEFLKNIPAFPLDISLAAYYISSTNTPYHQYLEHLKQYCDYFDQMQYEIFSQNYSYHKTRYSMIALTVKQLIGKNQDFGNMLFLISMIDSQNIPRELLEHGKSELLVSNFIYQLKKFSLLSDQPHIVEHNYKSLYLHRHIQELLLSYLMHVNDNQAKIKIMKECCLNFNTFIDKKIAARDVIQLDYLRPHYEKFMSHLNVLNFSETLGFKNQLGVIYYHLSLTEQSIQQFSNILNKMTATCSKDYARLAEVLQYLGMAYTERGEYKTAESYLQQNLNINQRHFPKNVLDIARTQALLGHVYGGLKQYKQAKNYVEQSLQIYDGYNHDNIEQAVALKYLSIILRGTGDYVGAKDMFERSLAIYQKTDDRLGIAALFAHLGNLTREIGYLAESKDLLEKSLKLYQDILPSNHTDIAWVMGHLGKTYLLRHDYDKAHATLEKSLSIYSEKYPPDHDYNAWITSYLGIYYCDIGQYEHAQQLLLRAIGICEHNNGKHHLDTARMYRELARAYCHQNQPDQAEKVIKQALQVFQDHHHPELYVSVEYLGDIIFKKFEATVDSTDRKQLMTECTQHYMQALQSIERFFPSDSIHITNLKSKLQKIMNNTL